MPAEILVLVNTTGRQAASVARVAAALAYHVRAHVHQSTHPVARELALLPNVDVLEGSLEDGLFLDALFDGAQEAFINTVSFGDEVKIGKALADMGKKKQIRHYVYSSMPDHGACNAQWPSLPLWSVKHSVEKYIQDVMFFLSISTVLLMVRSGFRQHFSTLGFITTTSLRCRIPCSV